MQSIANGLMLLDTVEVEIGEKVKRYPVNGYGADLGFQILKMFEMISILSRRRIYAQEELFEYLTTAEACAIVDVLNDIEYDGAYQSAKHILVHSFNFKDIDVKWQINEEELLTKLYALTEFQAYVLVSNAFEFWEKKLLEKNKNRDIAELVKEIFQTID